AVRDWLTDAGKPWIHPDRILAAPSPINSRLASTFSPCFTAKERAVSTESVNTIRVRMRAEGRSFHASAQLKSDRPNCGSLEGMGPTTVTPYLSSWISAER